MASYNVLVLVGIPGSGKSTFAQRLADRGWIKCCQDDLGDRVACERFAWEALSQGGRVVIDRCNVTVEERISWLDLCRAVRGPGVRVAAAVFRIPVDECIKRVRSRSDHPTLHGDDAVPVVEHWGSEFIDPTEAEGFASVFSCEGQQSFDSMLASLLCAGHKDSSVMLVESETKRACEYAAACPSEYGVELADVVGKMKCVYITKHCSDEFSSKEGRDGASVATARLRPEALAMFREGLFLPTVKVHGRCCMWKGGKPFRRLDIDLNGGVKGKFSRKIEAQVDAFMARVSNELGVVLNHCWQAGSHRSWTWRESLLQSWGWVATCLEGGWRPTSAPDRYGHWIGYTPVKHLDSRGRVLPVDHDADVRHGFDEARRIVFCLGWPLDDGTHSSHRCIVQEVPMTAVQDGTYELVGPTDRHAGPYKDSLPLVSEDLCYPVRFPGWSGARNERHYFIRHGSVQWASNAPPNPLDQSELRRWMQTSSIEGIVWHGRGRFSGCMYKCHFGHLGLQRPSLRFLRDEHVFMPITSSSSAQLAAEEVHSVDSAPGAHDEIRRCHALPSGSQQVVLLRHGQSSAQKVAQKQRSQDRGLLDAPLSAEGTRQAASVHVKDLPDLVVVSPLSRALQTVRPLLAQLLGCTCIAHPLLQEFSARSSKQSGWESIGRRLCELEKDDSIDLLSIDTSLLGGPKNQWWVDSADHAALRAQDFLVWLRARPERFVLIVGHNNFFRELLKDRGRGKAVIYEFQNCQPVHCEMGATCLAPVRAAAVSNEVAVGHSGIAGGTVTLRLCRAGDQKDTKIVNLPRAAGAAEVLQVAQNKWRSKRFRPSGAFLSDGSELMSLATLEAGTLVVCQ